MAKRGPKPSGEEKVVYYRRIVPGWVDLLEAKLDELKGGVGVDPTEATKGLESKGKASLGPLENNVKCAQAQRGLEKGMERGGWAEMGKVDYKVSGVPAFSEAEVKEMAALKKQLEDMTKDYEKEYSRAEKLSKEVGLFEKRREAWLRATDDQKTAYWRDRALRNESLINQKKNEFDQESV